MSNTNRENIGNEDNIDIYNSNIHSDINTSNNSSNTNNVDNYDMAIELNDSVNGSINGNTALENNITYNNDNYTHNNLNSSNMRYLSLNNSKSEDYPPRCNCRIKSKCPAPGLCGAHNVIYKCTITTENSKFLYLGCTIKFKQRVSNHISSFKLRHKAGCTTLSSKIWELKDNNIKYNHKWEIVRNNREWQLIAVCWSKIMFPYKS
ncbi:myelin gene regulatory factor-like A [Octopus sinensis]|uniref:Myelin gene regulatory factor-like A n=1 Tax=Octopus sinensis TaxID=2607531 RepID=A0A6P7SFY1_9MOLL|nr:myelin gene regulatory factor-like A [Octopus sinensis]